MRTTRVRRTLLAGGLFAVLVCLLVAGGVAAAPSDDGAGNPAITAADAETSSQSEPLQPSTTAQEGVSEEAFVEPVPEEGDAYFEAAADDGSWISYINPRDEYRSPYLGEGSGKLCVTMVNEQGEPVVGESVPDTTVTVPTGDELEWHTDADPFTVEYPLTENYDHPLDADQFGTTDDLPQGDGYFDSHCLEWHGLTENETVSYGEAEIAGPHADDVELVGYIQQPHESWDTDVDPIDDARSYEETGGGWTYHPDGSHGQVVVVLQLDGDDLEPTHGDGVDAASDDASTTDEQTDDGEGDSDDASADAEPLPGFGVLAALAGVALAVAERTRRNGG